MSHWSDAYIGLPWKAYATGPDAFDCWGLVYDVLQKHFRQRSLCRHSAIVPGDALAFHRAVLCEIQSGHWRKTDLPKEGDVVLLGKRKLFLHIGIVAGSSILNVRDGVGACRENEASLKYLFNRIEYWTYER